MLKKVLCLLLVFACSATLFACAADNGGSADLGSGEQNGDNDKDFEEGTEEEPGSKLPLDGKTELDYAREGAFFETISGSVYNLIKTKIETSNPVFGDSITCVDVYETRIYSESHYDFIYKQQVFNNVGDGDSLTTQLPEHTITYNNGEYLVDNVKVSARPDEASLQVVLNLDPAYLGSYSVSEGRDVLTTKLTAAELKEVLGITVNATGKIDFVVTTNGVSLYKIEVDYMCGDNSVHIETTYTYDPAMTPKQ